MNTIFRGMVGAAVLVAASTVSVSAQEYTWALTNFKFGDVFDGPAFTYSGTEETSGASGALVLKKIVGGYALKSFNFTTTADGFSGTGFAATYDSSINDFYGTDASSAFNTFIEIAGQATDNSGTEFAFHLAWNDAALTNEMSANSGAGNLGAVVALTGLNGYEYDFDGNFIRYNDDSQGNPPSGSAAFPGQMQLTGVITPEPASLALLGTGLLGIFAARRRKVA